MFLNILKKSSFLTCILLCSAFSRLQAQDRYHSGNEINANAATHSEDSTAVSAEQALVFPAILSGNEAESLEYIENFSKNRRDYLLRTYNKGKRLFSKATQILKKYKLPEELKVLLALESGFNGNAVSKAGAVGYWQIMDETAKQYGLRIIAQAPKNEKTKKQQKTVKLSADSIAKIKKLQAKDERRNFNKSTYAAARYLSDRSRNLNNDWLLVVASYNCGVGNVWDAMAQSGKENPTFWDIKELLPAETQGYVMNFITLNVIFNNYEKFANNTLAFQLKENKPAVAEQANTQSVIETNGISSFK